MAKQISTSDLVVLEDDLIINLSEVLLLDEDGDDQNSPITDEKYAEELQLQEALMASVLTSQMKTGCCSSSSSFIGEKNSKKKEAEMGESSSSSSQIWFCEICAEKKETEEMFNNNNNKKCVYSFCSDCISKHIAVKVERRSFINNAVSCPGLDCGADHALQLEACSSFLPKQVIEKWDEALCESTILKGSSDSYFYCPFKDCSAMLIIEIEDEEVRRECECPICHRLFCARCYVPWHPGVDCEEFQRLNEDERGRGDLMVKQLAKEMKWMRCPHCKFYVEKTQGCLHIVCRCNFQFCYGCGSEWTPTHGGCQRD